MIDNVEFVNTLDDCIDRLASGQSVEQCLETHPGYHTDLRPLLELGMSTHSLLGDMQEIQQARQQVMARMEREIIMPVTSYRWFNNRPYRLAYAARIAAVLVFLMATVGVLAQSSLPGDFLYPTKRFTEQIGLAITDYAPALEDVIAQRRLNEVQQVMQLGREADIVFTGRIDEIASDSLVIEGLMVQLEPDILTYGSYQSGEMVEVTAHSTRNGQLFSWQLRLVERQGHEAQPLPIATQQVPTDSPMPTHTETATIMLTPAVETITLTQPLYPETSTAVPVTSTCPRELPRGWYDYQVQAGDTLSSIAAQTGTSADILVKVNCSSNPSIIIVGDWIYVPREPKSAEETVETTGEPTPFGDSTQPSHSHQNAATPAGNENRNPNTRENQPTRNADTGGRENSPQTRAGQ